MLQVKELSVKFGDYTLLSNVSFSLEKGCWLMVAGPNGAGKSTLIHALAGTIPYKGDIHFLGKPQKSLTPRKQAKIVGVLSQHHSVNYSFTVEEVVRLGRYCHTPKLSFSANNQDDRKVVEALKMTDIWELRHHSVLRLSGGELQRVFLAQVFAQEPSILLLDEPTNHLDIGYQSKLFPLIQQWLEQGERAVLSVVHDLGLARCFGNQALLLNNGQILACGKKEQVFSSKHLEQAYGIPVEKWMQKIYEPWNTSVKNFSAQESL